MKKKIRRTTRGKRDCLADMYVNYIQYDPVPRVVQKAKALIEAMDAIESSPEYLAIWTCANLHGVKYTGKGWIEEREALRSAVHVFDVFR